MTALHGVSDRHHGAAADDLLTGNLAALTEVDPELATRLGDVSLAASCEPAVGRDGSRTFRIRVGDGQRAWLGGSSMPTITAPIAVEPVADNGSSVLLPTIGTGLETKRLAAKLVPHVGVFVYETEPWRLQAALSVCDLADELRRGRVIPICGPDVGAAVAERIGREPGLEFPQRIVTFAGQRLDGMDELRRSLEAAAPIVAGEQAAVVERLRETVRVNVVNAVDASRRAQPASERPRCVVMSIDARPEPLRVATALVRALNAESWPSALAVPDSPLRAHAAARLRVMAEHQPDWLLALNGGLTRLGADSVELPATVAWYWHSVSAAIARDDASAGAALRLATTTQLVRELNEHAPAIPTAPQALVELLEPGVDTTVYRADSTTQKLTRHVLIVADAVDLRPEAGHVQLPSHIELWKAACQIVAAQADTYHPSAASQMLDEAQRRSGVTLTEDELREVFVTMIRERIADTVVTRTAIERLLSARQDVHVLGSGWSAHDGTAAARHDALPDETGLARAYASAGLVVIPVLSPVTALRVLEVLACGGVPLFRRPDEPLSVLHPQLTEVLELAPSYARLDDLVRLAGGGAVGLRQRINAARECVLARHTLAHRFATIRARLAAAWTPSRDSSRRTANDFQ